MNNKCKEECSDCTENNCPVKKIGITKYQMHLVGLLEQGFNQKKISIIRCREKNSEKIITMIGILEPGGFVPLAAVFDGKANELTIFSMLN